MKSKIEKARKFWAKVAKDNGWYDERVKETGGFYVHLWVDKKGNVIDSLYQHPSVHKDTIEVGR